MGKWRSIMVTKRILLCISDLENVLLHGEKTFPVPTAENYGKHEGSKWIYVRDEIDDPILHGTVVVQIEIPAEKTRPEDVPAKNNLYHVSTKGASGYSDRKIVVDKNLSLNGEVSIKIE